MLLSDEKLNTSFQFAFAPVAGMASNAALIVGVSGIVGLPLAKQLLDKKWKVYGISRRYVDYIPSGVKHIPLDVTQREECELKLKELTDVTHVFFVIWVNCGPEKENCVVNRQLVSIFISNKQ